jgi:hypothetical protein
LEDTHCEPRASDSARACDQLNRRRQGWRNHNEISFSLPGGSSTAGEIEIRTDR